MNGNGNSEGQMVRMAIEFVQFPDGRKAVKATCDPPQLLGDKFTCYAMLEGVRDAIKDFCDKQQAAQQVVPVTMMPDFRGRG